VTDISAFAALFFPYGRYAAIAIDCVSIYLDYTSEPEPAPIKKKTYPVIIKLYDTSDRKEALIVLGLSEEQAKQSKLILEVVQKVKDALEPRIEKLAGIPKYNMQLMLDEAIAAAKTLLKDAH